MTSRRPEFHVPTQTWHWWSSPEGDPSWDEDAASAVPIDVTWTVSKDGLGGRCWRGDFDALPGFLPFMWSVKHGEVFLRRPEGTWKTSLPRCRHRDYLSMTERCPALPSGFRPGVLALPEHNESGWHWSGSEIPLTLRHRDAEELAAAFVGQNPVLETPIDHQRFKRRGPVIVLPLWSEPGPMRFHWKPVTFREGQEMALVIDLPNGISVVERMARDLIGQHLLKRGQVWAELGDDRHLPLYKQRITDLPGVGNVVENR